MGIIWLPWDFLEKTGIEKFLCLQHSFPPFCKYLEIIANLLLFDWALGFIHTKYYRCHYTSSTLNFKNIERGVKLLTGRNTRCLLCSSTSCLCSTWNGKVLWTGYHFIRLFWNQTFTWNQKLSHSSNIARQAAKISCVRKCKECCDMGQNDTVGKIELNPLSSCQVMILIARMTFNCSTSCLMS